MPRELVGHCGVDSGLIFIGDPCYIKSSPALYCGGQTVRETPDKSNPYFPYIDNTNKAKGWNLPDKWQDLCDKIFHKDTSLPCEMYNGVLTRTRHGDGSYPVYVTKDKEGNVKKMEIIF
jgi:hypothetical protein